MDALAERDKWLLTLERERRPAVRADAAEALCDIAFEAPRAVRGEFAVAVVRLLADEQSEVRCAGLALASEVLDGAEAQAIFERAVAEKDPRVRLEAVGRLADLASPTSRGVLAAALEDGEANIRFEAARGMVALKHPAGLSVLLAALDDSELRFRAAAALAQLGNAEALPKLREVFGRWLLPAFDRTQVAGALAALGDETGVAHLIKRLGSRWSMDRAMAMELLGEVKAAPAKGKLLEVLADPKDPSRGAAARGLGRLGDASVEPELVKLLSDRLVTDDVKLDVAEGLLRLGTASGRGHVGALKLEDTEAQAELVLMREEFES